MRYRVLSVIFLVSGATAHVLFVQSKFGRDGRFHSNRPYKGIAQSPLPPARSTPSTNYVCVPAGTCNTNPNNGTIVIDPRIVIPNLCPSGQVPCYTGQAGGSQCGIRYVTSPINLSDGTATYAAYPWQAYVENQTGYIGGGVLLDRLHVLTAAHKVYLNVNTPSNVRVYLGMWDTSNRANTQVRTAASISIVNGFNSSTLRDDLAMITLNFPVALGTHPNIGTACLPTASQSFVGQNCTVSGWGQTAWSANDAPTRVQKQVTVPIVSYTSCRGSMNRSDVLGSRVDEFLDPVGEICAGGGLEKDACTQDGGSPLVCNQNGRFVVAGLVIWGKQCGLEDVYGVYVSVSNPAYLQWINGFVTPGNAG